MAKRRLKVKGYDVINCTCKRTVSTQRGKGRAGYDCQCNLISGRGKKRRIKTVKSNVSFVGRYPK